jgi:cytochrome c oxidase subunit II
MVTSAIAIAMSMSVSACGGSGGSSASAAGQDAAQSLGCAGCHGAHGQGGIGPAWRGLAGSHVELADGTSVIANDAYLRRSITRPSAQRVKGYNVQMPKLSVTPTQLDDLLAYIHSLK